MTSHNHKISKKEREKKEIKSKPESIIYGKCNIKSERLEKTNNLQMLFSFSEIFLWIFLINLEFQNWLNVFVG